MFKPEEGLDRMTIPHLKLFLIYPSSSFIPAISQGVCFELMNSKYECQSVAIAWRKREEKNMSCRYFDLFALS